MRYEVFGDHSLPQLSVHVMGYSDDPAVTRFGPGRRNQFIIHYVLDGEGFYNGHPVRKGQGFLISPGQKELYFPSADHPWLYLWIVATGDAMPALFARYPADESTQVFAFGESPLFRHAIAFIRDNNRRVVDSLKLLEWFVRLMNTHASPQSAAPHAATYLDFCASYIETHLSRKVTVGELTSMLGVSQPYLHRLFTRHFHMSAQQYIITCKLAHAKGMLLHTDLSVAEIARSVGYEDALAFSKMFKQYEQLSPAQYRLHPGDR